MSGRIPDAGHPESGAGQRLIPARRGRGRPVERERFDPSVEAALQRIKPAIGQTNEPMRAGAWEALSGSESKIAQTGLGPLFCWMRFRGLSRQQCAQELGVSDSAVEVFSRSPYFAKLYDYERQAMLAKVDEHFREMLQGEVLKNIVTMVTIRDSDGQEGRPKVQARVRMEAALQLTKMYEKFVGVGKGAPTGILERLREVTRRQKLDGSVSETIRETVKGDVETMAAAGLVPHEHDAAGGGSEAGPERAAGEEDREAGVIEAEIVAGGGGDQRDGGESDSVPG